MSPMSSEKNRSVSEAAPSRQRASTRQRSSVSLVVSRMTNISGSGGRGFWRVVGGYGTSEADDCGRKCKKAAGVPRRPGCLACAGWRLGRGHAVPPRLALVVGRNENRREGPTTGCRHHADVRGARDPGEALVPAVRREVSHRFGFCSYVCRRLTGAHGGAAGSLWQVWNGRSTQLTSRAVQRPDFSSVVALLEDGIAADWHDCAQAYVSIRGEPLL